MGSLYYVSNCMLISQLHVNEFNSELITKKQILEVNLMEIRRINKSRDLIEIWFMLINATRENLVYVNWRKIKVWESICVKIAIIKGSKTKMNGCWSFERQINLIKGEIKRIKSMKEQLRMKLKNIKIKDHTVKDTKCSINWKDY